MRKLSVVIPCFNEKNTVELVVRDVLDLSIPDWQIELIIVDDASTDGTKEILNAISKEKPGIKVIFNEKNAGKGSAVVSGLRASTGDYILIQDADLEYNPKDIPELLKSVDPTNAKIVYGSRNLSPRTRRGGKIARLGVWVITKIINIFYNTHLTDAWTCYKLFPASIKNLFSTGRFESELMFTVRALREGFSIVEVPISYNPRPMEEGKKIRYRDGFKAIFSILKDRITHIEKSFIGFFVIVSVLLLLFMNFLGPKVMSDTKSYVDTMSVLSGEAPKENFLPNRVLTTFIGLELIRYFSIITGLSIYSSWFLINTSLYTVGLFIFYRFLLDLLDNKAAVIPALLGVLFLAGNYGFVQFGLHYLMDIGGWFFYLLSMYLLLRYSKTGNERALFLSALSIGIGGLYKEYALLGAVAIAVYLIVENRKNISRLFKLAAITSFIALLPLALLYFYVYTRFGYTYLDWLGHNNEYYTYSSRIIEYIKAGGSLINVLAFPFLLGLWQIFKNIKSYSENLKTVLLSFVLSFTPVFVWPAITQRILTITIPFVATVATYGFYSQKNKPKFLFMWLLLGIVYVIFTFFMDSHILPGFNLPF